jgi:hypothetical protein
MPDERKTLEQRIADIESNLKKLERRSPTRTFPGTGKIILGEKGPKQTPDQQKQTLAEKFAGRTRSSSAAMPYADS